jgi:hypothetical protein
MSVLTARMADALSGGAARGIFVQIEHPSGTGYFWSGVGSRTWNGHTWSGVGKLGHIGPVKHTSEIAIQDIVFTLTGVDSDIIAKLEDDVRNRNGSVWLACFSPLDDSVIADPYQLIDSELDFQTYEVQPDGTATISITAHSGFYTLDRGTDEAWTRENQVLLFPTDTGMDMIASLQNQNLQWTPV